MSERPDRPDLPVVVVGAGAAGLMAAIFAARAGADVILLERTRDGGRKILISGGGRCNVLPSVLDPERYVTDSSANSLRRILRSWPLSEQQDFFQNRLGLRLVREEETGKLFPESNRARDVRDGLVQQVRDAGARIWFDARVTGLRTEDGRWWIGLEGTDDLEARAVVVATGGLSVPATGSDGAGLRWLEGLGHTLHETYPALTPLTAAPHPHAELAGVSLDAKLTAPGARPAFSTQGGFLFTHRGWSGPSVLDTSHMAIRGRPDGSRQEVHVAWAGDGPAVWDERLRTGRSGLRAALTSTLPRRLADTLIKEAGVAAETPLAELKKADRKRLVRLLGEYPLPWTGDEGYKKAEVTGGGVALSEVNPGTMESRRAPGLYLCGEILDAFGPIGGYNFVWAWVTGRAAGSAVAGSD